MERRTADVDPTLGIADVAARTGLGEPTLRMWEARYGFPVPARTPSGHRRYALRDVEGLVEILRLRNDGLALKAAIARVRAAARGDEQPSLFALLQRGAAQPVQPLRKRTLIALSRAIEDECCRQAPHAFVAAFQHASYLEAALPRYRDLARTAEAAIAFAVLPARLPAGRLVTVPLAADDPLVREWFVAGWGPDCAAALAGWERPDTARERIFECLWSVERGAVRTVMEAAAQRATCHDPAAARRLRDALVLAGRDELQALQALTSRMVAYVAARNN